MADDARLRVEKLLEVLRHREGGNEPIAYLSRHAGRSQSFWSQVIAGNKPFGERLARNAEELLGLPRYTLEDTRSVSALYIADLFEKLPPEAKRHLLAVAEAASNPAPDVAPVMLAAVGRLLDSLAAATQLPPPPAAATTAPPPADPRLR